MLRVSRELVQQLWLAVMLISSLEGKGCRVRVIAISATIKLLEKKAIRYVNAANQKLRGYALINKQSLSIQDPSRVKQDINNVIMQLE